MEDADAAVADIVAEWKGARDGKLRIDKNLGRVDGEFEIPERAVNLNQILVGQIVACIQDCQLDFGW